MSDRSPTNPDVPRNVTEGQPWPDVVRDYIRHLEARPTEDA